MTQEQRDWGKVISVAIVAAILLIAGLAGCTPYMYRSCLLYTSPSPRDQA